VPRKPPPAPKLLPAASYPVIDILSLDMEARGVGRLVNEDGSPGKVVFVDDALPGERVRYATFRRKSKFEQATLVEIVQPSSMRVKPPCPVFDTCGGCSMQHLDVRAQIAVKQRVLEDNLLHLARLRPEMMYRPIHGSSSGYRFRARLSVRHVSALGGVLVGFHSRKSNHVVDMRSCEVLPAHVSALLGPLREMIAAMSVRERLPQIELAIGRAEDGASVTALVLRVLDPIDANDEALLRAFADLHQVQFWLQLKGPDTAFPFYPADHGLAYLLPEYNIRMPFRPTDFTQVNHQINRVLVHRALSLLAPGRGDRVLDLFCGIGNFTLPLARISREVMGIEGSEALTRRALENAQANGVEARTAFATRNLFEITADDLVALGPFDKYLVDPPREGALALAQALAELHRRGEDGFLPKRIVYVSCNPSTLARDAGVLVNEAGYHLRGAGVVNMFPHTSHVESIALFERD
jgi:23S rRNA (uracil1939-C5)-methyltransferase